MQTVPAKTIVTRNKSTAWFGCEYNMNIYRGCCHGCLYCDSRSDCYHIEKFDTVRAKEDALRIVRNDLARRVKTGMVATGAMSDPYNPFEKEQKLTRHAMELLEAYGFGAAIATKSDMIVRDIDILQGIQKTSPVLCKFTITAADDAMAAKIEPHAPSSSRRFEAIKALAKAGLFCGVLMMPILPYITDTEKNITEIIKQTAECGAKFVYPSFGVTMRAGQREYFLQGLDKAFPGAEYAKQYRSRFGGQYHCASPQAKRLWQIFVEACKKAGLLYEMRDIVAGYKQGYERTQLSFL